jgi:hypothetical protein
MKSRENGGKNQKVKRENIARVNQRKRWKFKLEDIARVTLRKRERNFPEPTNLTGFFSRFDCFSARA